MADQYPARFDVEYPDRDLSRLTTFFRLFTIIPIYIVLALVIGAAGKSDPSNGLLAAGGILVAGPVVMILFRKKYPRWWFDWNLELSRFAFRVAVYGALLDDTYPSTDEKQSVTLDLDYPDVENDLSRGMPLIKWLLAIPHWFILLFLFIAEFFVVIVAWFAILFTGRYPRGMFDFVVGVHRWLVRVDAYAVLMVTDEYPPFSLKA